MMQESEVLEDELSMKKRKLNGGKKDEMQKSP